MPPIPKTEYLAEAFRDILIKPLKSGAGERMRALMQKHPHRAKAAINSLNSSHRYILEDDFTALAARFSTSNAETMLKAARFCRMPFDNVWIEWNDRLRRLHCYDGSSLAEKVRSQLPARRGLLLTTVPIQKSSLLMEDAGDDLQIVHVQPVFGPFTHQDPDIRGKLAKCMMGLAAYELYLREDAIVYGSGIRELMVEGAMMLEHPDRLNQLHEWEHEVWPTAIGNEYVERERSTAAAATEQLMTHTSMSSSLLYPDAMSVFTISDRDHREDLQQDLFITGGDVRFAIAVLSLLTDKPQASIRMEPAGSGGNTFRHGKFVPKYEYKVLSITRPTQEIIIKLKETVAEYLPWAGRPLHTVEAHWCYSHRHGRDSCPHPDWTRRYDDAGNRIGKDMWACVTCGKYRWRREQHQRGNRERGIIDKGYEVHAPPHAAQAANQPPQ